MTALLQRWGNRITRRHPSRDRLLEAAFGETGTPAALATARHLRRCAPCTRRARDLRTFLGTLADAAGASFDEVFPPARLQAQRTRIDHRLAQAAGRVEPARVLAFPFRRRRPERRAHLDPRRWVVAAAAVGLALGMVSGQLVHFYLYPAPGSETGVTLGAGAGDGVDGTLDIAGTIELPPAPADPTAPATPLTLSEFEQVMTEATFFDTLDVALIDLPVAELESIDALTPHVGDLSPTIR